MIDEKYIKEFNFNNVVYLGLGALVFGFPWLLFPDFWARLVQIPLWKMVFVEVMAVLFLLIFFASLLIKKHKLSYSLAIAFRRLFFVYITVFVVATAALVGFGRIAFADPLAIFGRAMLTAHIVTCA